MIHADHIGPLVEILNRNEDPLSHANTKVALEFTRFFFAWSTQSIAIATMGGYP